MQSIVSPVPPPQLLDRRFWRWWMTVNIATMWIPMRSAAEICPAAIMEAIPGPVIHHGHPINITCTLTGNTIPCHPGSKEGVKIYWNMTLLPGRLRKGSATAYGLRPPPGETVYQCWRCKTLCVISVFAGFPPDQPRSVTCDQEGESGKVSCSWDSGRKTFLDTTYTLQLLQKTHNVTISGKYSSQVHQSVQLPVTIVEGAEYTVLVKAHNELGENVSRPYTFTYIDAVKPYPPDDVLVTCGISHNCTVTINTDQDIPHFQLWYRITNSSVWKQEKILNSSSLTLRGLRPLSQYEFQAACKYGINRGKWSNWSKIVTYETPEDAPRDSIYVWYRLHGTNTGVTIFWKYMNVSEFWGHIQYYQVIIHDNDIYIENTTNSWLSRNTEREGCEITVTAHNSIGSSPATYLRVTTHSLSGFPAPTNVISQTSTPGDITLRWELPSGIDTAGDQIVTWEDPTRTDPSHTNWIIVPKHNTSVTISGLSQPHICYQFYVYLLWEGRAGRPGITQGSTQQRAPLSGPTFKYEVHKENTIVVTWQEIPGKERMGCITHYTIYLWATAQTTRVIKVSSNQSGFYRYEIENIKKSVHYSLEMTCSNEAGESPPSPLISAYIQPDVSEDTMMGVIVFGVVLLFIGLVISVFFAKQRLYLFSSIILPLWWSKAVPDPANCEWAKEYITNMEKKEFLKNVVSSISDYEDDTETLEVEEIVSEDEESPTSVFSYKIGISQDVCNITSEEESGGVSPTWSIKLDGAYRSLDADRSSSVYQLHQNMRSVDYMIHHDINPSGNVAHQEIKSSDYLVQHDKYSLTSMVHCGESNYLAHQELKPLRATVNYIHHSRNDEIKVNYLPNNMLAIVEASNQNLFHHQLFLPTRETISLDTVQINFPSEG